MGLFGFLKGSKVGKKESNLFISLDIGTELLKGILFSISDLGVTAIKHEYLRQPSKAMRSGVILDSGLVTHGVATVIEKLLADIPYSAYPTMLGIAGELINGVSVEVTYIRNKPSTAINEVEETNILEYVYNKIAVEGLKELAKRLGTTPNNVTVLHIGVVGLNIDGRPHTKLLGAKGKEVKLFIYSSFAPKDYILSLKNIMQDVGLDAAGIVAQPYAVARAFKGGRDIGFSGIFVDIGGGTTDVAIVNKGFKLITRMYAFGGRLFTESVAKNLGVSLPVAEEYKIKYSYGQLPTETAVKVRGAIAEDVRLWVDSFKTALEDLSVEVDTLPTTIYLCGGGAMLPDLVDALRNYTWTNVLPFIKHPSINIMTPQSLERVYLQDPALTRPYDVTPISLGRVYYDIYWNLKYNYVTKPSKVS